MWFAAVALGGRGFSNRLHPLFAHFRLSLIVTRCQDGDDRLRPLWASEIIFFSVYAVISEDVCFSGSRAEVLEAKQQAEAANASLLEALERLEEYRVKLDASSSAVASANHSIRSTVQLLRDSEETGQWCHSTLLNTNIYLTSLISTHCFN